MTPPLKKQRRNNLPINELTENKKTTLQKLSFNKRVSTLKSKAQQLSILCDVDVCLVCFEPDGNCHTWPEDRSVAKDTINKLMKLNLDPKKKTHILGILETRKKNLEGKKQGFASKEIERMMESWNEQKQNLSLPELTSFDSYLSNKLDALKGKIESKKEAEAEDEKRKGKEIVDQLEVDNGFSLNPNEINGFDFPSVFGIPQNFPSGFPIGFAHNEGTQNYDTWCYPNDTWCYPNDSIAVPTIGLWAPDNFTVINSNQFAAHGGLRNYDTSSCPNDSIAVPTIGLGVPDNFTVINSNQFAAHGGLRNYDTSSYPNDSIAVPTIGLGVPDNFTVINSNQFAAHGGLRNYDTSSIENVFSNNGVILQPDIVSSNERLELINLLSQIQQRHMGVGNFDWMDYTQNAMLLMDQNQIN